MLLLHLSAITVTLYSTIYLILLSIDFNAFKILLLELLFLLLKGLIIFNITPTLTKLPWLPVKKSIEFKIATITYKSITK